MSGVDPLAGSPECGGDAAAYVLGALEPDELAAFERHMATCVVCRDEVAALQPVVQALPAAAPQYAAPRSLRRRVLRAVRDEPRQAAASRSTWGFSARLLPAMGAARAAMAVAAAAIIALVVVVAAGSGSGAATLIHASVGQAELRIAGGHGELIVRDLPPPPTGKIYEVWLKRGDHPPSPTSALFSVTSRDTADIGVPGSLKGVSAVMVTPEPYGGSRVPTHQPVIVAQLT